ncbi:MAG: hypothetical protein ACKVWV_12005 [Planctomycetota bacterium]
MNSSSRFSRGPTWLATALVAIPSISFAHSARALALQTAPPPAPAPQSGASGASTTTPPAAPQQHPQEHNPRAPGAPSKDAMTMGSPPSLPSDTPREGMWPAPTAADWALPCLLTWQRTFDDALAVAQATTKPILICVNMDGEIASEHYAGIRYRREETAKLYEPYVCVVASVYRHSPRDYDDEGRRVECPRFGTVTCGEHIAIEPLLYDKYFDGNRIAPRHIMIELDQKKTYDVYFAWDTQTIFTALVKGVEGRPPPRPDVLDDRPVVERVASANVLDREAIEIAYEQGSREVRRELIESAIRHRDLDQIDLLRRAIFGLDLELARLARRALAQSNTEAAVDLIAEALKVPMDAAERDALLAAAERLAQTYPRARTLVAVQRGLSGTSSHIDAEALVKAADSARTTYEATSALESRAASSEARPQDPRARLQLARSYLSRAHSADMDRRFSSVMIEDARRAALEAEQLGASGFELDALLAVTASKRGERGEALARAVKAVEAGVGAPADGEAPIDASLVEVFALFAQARQAAIAKAYREKSSWPPEWLSDIHAAYAVLARHQAGTDAHVASHYDFLRWLGATPRASQALEDGLARFPDSPVLHERVRTRALIEKGPDGLEATYATLLAQDGASPKLAWFAGYASLVAAEQHRRTNAAEKALAAYARGIAHFERYVERDPDGRDNAEHFLSIAIAGRARVELERGDLERATNEILAAFAQRPSSAASADGLSISAVDTANMLRARLADAQRADLVVRVEAGLAALDPALLELPDFERNVPAPGGDAGRRGRRPR